MVHKKNYLVQISYCIVFTFEKKYNFFECKTFITRLIFYVLNLIKSPLRVIRRTLLLSMY